MFIENLVQVIPSELIMPLAGYLVAQEKMELIPTVIAGTTGTVAGTLPWYLIGRSINEEKIGTYLDKHGQWLGLGSKKLQKSKEWFNKHGALIVFWGRLIPVLRTGVSIPAGIELMPLKKFLVWTSLGSLIWNFLLTYAGVILGKNWEAIHQNMKGVSIFIVFSLLGGVLVYAALRALRRTE